MTRVFVFLLALLIHLSFNPGCPELLPHSAGRKAKGRSKFVVYYCIGGNIDYLLKLFPDVFLVEWQTKHDDEIRGDIDVLVYGFNHCPEPSVLSRLKRVLVVNDLPGESAWESHGQQHVTSRIDMSMEKGYVYIGGLGLKVSRQRAADRSAFTLKYPNILGIPYSSIENVSEILKENRKYKNATRSHFLAYAHQYCQPYRESVYDSLVELSSQIHTEKPDALSSCHGSHPETSHKDFRRFMEKGANRSYVEGHSDVNYFGDYRFILCMENTFAEGYITEKILNVFSAGSIPIYYGGGQQLFDIFNPRSFIYYDVNHPRRALELIKHLERDKGAYTSMLSQPVLRHSVRTLEDYFSLDGHNGGKLQQKVWKLLRLYHYQSYRHDDIGRNMSIISSSIRSGDDKGNSTRKAGDAISTNNTLLRGHSIMHNDHSERSSLTTKTYNMYSDKQVHEVECNTLPDKSWVCATTRTVIAPVFIFRISAWQRNLHNAITAITYAIAGGTGSKALVPMSSVRDGTLANSTFHNPKVYYFQLIHTPTHHGGDNIFQEYNLLLGVTDHNSMGRFISTKFNNVKTIAQLDGWQRVCSTFTDKRRIPYLLEMNSLSGDLRIRMDVELMKLINHEFPGHYSLDNIGSMKNYNISDENKEKFHKAKINSMAVSDDGCVVLMCMQNTYFVRIQTCTDGQHHYRREEFDRIHVCHTVKLHTDKHIAISMSHLHKGITFLTYIDLPFSDEKFAETIQFLGTANINGCHGISHLVDYTDTLRGIQNGVSFIASAAYDNRFFHIIVKLDGIYHNRTLYTERKSIIFPTMIELVSARGRTKSGLESKTFSSATRRPVTVSRSRSGSIP